MSKADDDAIAPKSKKRDRVSEEVKKLRKDTIFLAAVKEAIAEGGNNREVVSQLFEKGFGANKNTKPYQETMVAIFKNAIAQIENQSD